MKGVRGKYISTCADDTMAIARDLALTLKKGDVVMLRGDLGAGKTLFVKGVLSGLGMDPDIARSPTFNVVREYDSDKFKIYHIDLYRIDDISQLNGIGYDEFFWDPEGVTFVEWSEKVSGEFDGHMLVEIKYLSETKRSIEIKRIGKK